MPFPIKDLIGDRGRPETAQLDETLHSALQRMIEHDYSQLPVVDDADRPLGMITTDSIVRIVDRLQGRTDRLRVLQAMDKVARLYKPEDDLFQLLDDLQSSRAVLIVDQSGGLIGIVTDYDTGEYFRQRSEDIMYVEDIETSIKSYIRLIYSDKRGNFDENAIARFTSPAQRYRKDVNAVLSHYLSKLAPDRQARVDQKTLQSILNEHLGTEDTTIGFDDLTLAEYNQLFLHKDKWKKLEDILHV